MMYAGIRHSHQSPCSSSHTYILTYIQCEKRAQCANRIGFSHCKRSTSSTVRHHHHKRARDPHHTPPKTQLHRRGKGVDAGTWMGMSGPTITATSHNARMCTFPFAFSIFPSERVSRWYTHTHTNAHAAYNARFMHNARTVADSHIVCGLWCNPKANAFLHTQSPCWSQRFSQRP